MAAKARILCLHGYAQNGAFFRQRTGSLRRALKPLVADFVFVDAPFPATAAFLEASEERGAALGWWSWEEAERARTPSSFAYRGVEQALDRVRDAVAAEGPFDGVLGFSQGATLAALLCLEPSAPPFRFAVLIAGFLPHDPVYAARCAAHPAEVRTLHVSGAADERVPPERTLALAACFAAPAFHAHAGGHAIPSDAAFRTALRDFVADAHGASGGACDASDAGRDAPPAGGWAAEVGARCESSYLSWRAVRGAPEPS